MSLIPCCKWCGGKSPHGDYCTESCRDKWARELDANPLLKFYVQASSKEREVMDKVGWAAYHLLPPLGGKARP